jgi:hypothetical protein
MGQCRLASAKGGPSATKASALADVEASDYGFSLLIQKYIVPSGVKG